MRIIRHLIHLRVAREWKLDRSGGGACVIEAGLCLSE